MSLLLVERKNSMCLIVMMGVLVVELSVYIIYTYRKVQPGDIVISSVCVYVCVCVCVPV